VFVPAATRGKLLARRGLRVGVAKRSGRDLLVDFDDYEHPVGECMSGPYAHFTGPKWCGHPSCLFTSSGGDLAAIEGQLIEHGYDRHQVARMMESFYLPLCEQKIEGELLPGSARGEKQ
jgi:hypothetical protein